MTNEAWYSSIARVIAIVLAVGFYIIAMIAILRKPRKHTPPPSNGTTPSPIQYSGPERRIYPRAKLDVVVRYKLSGIKGVINVFKEGRIRDISEGGLLLIEAQDKLAADDVLEFKFKLPTADHFMLLRGNIVWVKELEPDRWYNYGISVAQIDPNDRKCIAKYVAEVSEKEERGES